VVNVSDRMNHAQGRLANEALPAGHRPHVMPWWLGPLLASPIRRLRENPERLVAAFVRPGGKVLEVGPGMGFFTLPLARGVGEQGRVVCVDVQPRMLRGLSRRLERRGLAPRVAIRQCGTDSLGIADLDGSTDLVLAIHVVHEMQAPGAAFQEMARALRSGGRLLLLEPAGHCPERVFQAELDWAARAGLARIGDPEHVRARDHKALFEKR
jgi:ubiquinone/menaquinone biosynthesis C-methylase UbiE